MLEAGRKYVPEQETPMFQTPDQAPLRGASTPDKAFGFYDATVDGGWTVPGEPYVQSTNDPHGRFAWWRSRMLGGRTNHWGRISLRNGPYDFKPHTPRRPGVRLAHLLRGRRAVLRQSREADRRLRHQRGIGEHAEFLAGVSAAAARAPGQRSTWCSSAPRRWAFRSSPVIARCSRSSSTSSARRRCLHPGNPKAQKIIAAAHAAARGLLLGDRLRPRLLDPRELPVHHRASAAGARHRQSRHRHRCHGAARSCWARTGAPRA